MFFFDIFEKTRRTKETLLDTRRTVNLCRKHENE